MGSRLGRCRDGGSGGAGANAGLTHSYTTCRGPFDCLGGSTGTFGPLDTGNLVTYVHGKSMIHVPAAGNLSLLMTPEPKCLYHHKSSAKRRRNNAQSRLNTCAECSRLTHAHICTQETPPTSVPSTQLNTSPHLSRHPFSKSITHSASGPLILAS